MSPPSRPRILMTADAVGGVWVYAAALARALCRAGHDVLLVVMGPAPRTDQLRPLAGVGGLNVQVTDLQLEWTDPEGADFDRAGETLLHIADAFGPDLVHLNGFREAQFDWPAPVLVVAHSCVQTWWRACRGSAPNERRWALYAENVAAGLSAADAWAAPTAAFRQQIADMYAPLGEGAVIRNGLAVQSAAPPSKQKIILGAGRLWDEAKNLKALAAIAAGLPWPVHVAGPTQPPDQSAGPLDHLAAVTMLGALSHRDVLDEMSRASVFVAPALYEPFGLTILEAAANGCALVLSDIPSLRELWDDAALFVDPRDHAALRRTVQSVCSHDGMRGCLQAAARARAERYSVQAMASGYRRLYRTIVSDSRALQADAEFSFAELPA
jgi:glycosyltransferase involved in cell wall biosynthesis